MKFPYIKKGLWTLIIGFILIATIICAFFLLPYDNKNKTIVQPISFLGTYQLEDGSPPKPITNSTYIDACENEKVTFRGNFSETLKKDTQILFFMEYLEVRILKNNEEIFSWGGRGSYPEFMHSSGAAWGHCILNNTITENDEITIVLKSKYQDNYNSAYHDFMNHIQIGDSGALARQVLNKSWPFLVIGLLMFLIGIALLIYIISLTCQGVALHRSIYFCALFILSASLWLVLNPIYSTLIFGNATIIMLLETVTMWLFSVFLFGYFGTFMHGKTKFANDINLLCFTLMLILYLILQMFGVVDAYEIRGFHNILVGVSGLICLCLFWKDVFSTKKSMCRTLALPGLLYVIFGFAEMLNYEYEWFLRGSILAIGFAIFIIAQFVFSVRQIKNSMVMALKAASLEKDLTQSRTSVMLSQIQPHFLYNALTGIKILCSIDPEKAEDAMEHFSYFLRNNLDSLSNLRLIDFDKEISHVKDYFYLEQMRFSDRVRLVLNLQVRDFQLPPLTIQPLVENAVRYGITKKDVGGTITISSAEKNGQICVIITDDGVGFDTFAIQDDGHSHTGIENVRNRIKIQCDGTLEVKSEKGVGTVVRITLPIKGETV